ncbi:MAG: hypothetical protein KGV59_01505 [Tenacibaculum sp.]|nr:hypothetical protein [Tenacibaculum sp.]
MDVEIFKPEQEGGWFVAQIIMVDEFAYCPAVLTNDNSDKIIITPKNTGLDILPVAETIKINATPRTGKSGTSYNIKAEFEVATQSKEIDSYFNDCIHKKVAILGIKHYGDQILYGSPTCPLEFSYRAINGVKYEDGCLFKIKVEGTIPQKPVYL